MVNFHKDDRRRLTDSLCDKDDLRDLRDQLMIELRNGFTGVHARQDITNGRLNGVEKTQSAHDAKIEGLQREVYRRQEIRRNGDPLPSDVETAPPAVSGGRIVSQRDVAIVLSTVGAGLAFIKGLSWLAPLFGKIIP